MYGSDDGSDQFGDRSGAERRAKKYEEQDQLRKSAGMDPKDPPVMITGFGELSLSQAIVKIKEDAAKLVPGDTSYVDLLFIRNAANAAIEKLKNGNIR